MDVSAYYRSALCGLRYVEHRRATGRRFGADADARWKGLRGALTTADRINLLIRDADAQWPGAFGPRTVFNFGNVAEDEPFGVPWPGIRAVEAEELWRQAAQQENVTSLQDLCREVFAAWGLELHSHPVDSIAPAEKLVAVGPRAVCALAGVFHETASLDWVDQVVCVATPPSHRQVAALAGAVLNVTSPAVLLAAGESPESLRLRGRRLVCSEDAAPDDLAHAKALTGGGDG